MSFPRPRQDDEDDVVWALQTARVQWDRGARADAIVWIRRASDAALQAGSPERSRELRARAEGLVEYLWSSAPVPDEEAPTSEGARRARDTAAGARGSHAEPQALTRGDAGSPAGAVEFNADSTDVMPHPEVNRRRSPDPPSMRPDMDTDVDGVYDDEEVEELDAEALQSLPAGDAISEPPPASSEEERTAEQAVHSSSQPELTDVQSFAEQAAVDAGDGDSTEEETRPLTTMVAAVRGILLAEVAGFEDLPEEAQLALAQIARYRTLDAGEELPATGAVLILQGSMRLGPLGSDRAAVVLERGDLFYAHGSLPRVPSGQRLVASVGPAEVALWPREDLARQMRDCPWVADEFRRIADRYQALVGVVQGPLGARLDDSLRTTVTDRLQAIALRPAELIVAAGQRIPGLHLLGVGQIEILAEDGETVESVLEEGEFLFAAEEMSAAAAPRTARAGQAGAVILFGQRQVAYELLTSVPPLVEILSS